MTSSTLRSNTRSNGSSSPTVLVLDTTPGVSSTYTARLQSPYSSEYGKLVDTTLRQNVGPQPPHTCTVLALGPTDKAVDAERHHYLECKKTFIHVKLRELMTALLSGLCGVKHPNTALPDGLYPRTHFMEWLREAFHPRDKVFTIQQRPPTLLQPSNLQGNPTTETSPAQVPLIVGGASALCFGQLVSIFDGLGGLSSHANEVVHSLTVGEVVRVLADPAALQILGETAIRCLINLIEAIIGSTIQEVKSDWDSRLARRQFKAEARDFRRKIRNTALLTTIEDVWKPNFEEAAAESQIKSLITRNLVVTPSQVSSTKSDVSATANVTNVTIVRNVGEPAQYIAGRAQYIADRAQ